MVRFFPTNWEPPHEIRDPSSELNIQARRIKWLHRYGMEKSEGTDDLPRLVNLMKLGTDRVISSMRWHISHLDAIQKSHKMSLHARGNILRFQVAFERIQTNNCTLLSNQSPREYIEQHLKLSESLQQLFEDLKKENRSIIQQLEKIPGDTFLKRMTLNEDIIGLEKLCIQMKDICMKAVKMMGIATLSISVASAGNISKIDSIGTSTNERTVFSLENSSLVSGQVSSVLADTSGIGSFFQKFRNNPNTVAMIPEMKPELLLPVLKSHLFDEGKYQDGVWQEWNLQIVQKLFPRISITPENAETFVHALQSHLGFTKTDGKFWLKTKGRLIGYFSKIQKTTGLSVSKKVSDGSTKAAYPNDSPLASEEDFRERYTSFMKTLGWQLQIGGSEFIWAPLMMAITAKESTYGQYLKSKTGSTGVMQLTKWPFADMKGETKKVKKRTRNGDSNREFSKRFDQAKVRAYQKIFQRIDLENLRKIPYGNTGKTFGSTLPENIWTALEKIQNGTAMMVSDTIEELEQYEKGRTKNNYLHSLNLIIGGVYATYIGDNQLRKKGERVIWEDILAIAKRYNGDSNQKIRNDYARSVLSQYRKEVRIKT